MIEYDIVVNNMSKIRSSSTRTERISLSLSPEELAQWKFFNNKESLSAFIRTAVHAYIKKLEHNPTELTKIQQNISIIQTITENNINSIQKIEEDLLDIQVALAKHDILPELETDLQLKRFLDQQLDKLDLPVKDRKIYTQLRRKIK